LDLFVTFLFIQLLYSTRNLDVSTIVYFPRDILSEIYDTSRVKIKLQIKYKYIFNLFAGSGIQFIILNKKHTFVYV
jgi:hypothetical protein